MVELWFLKKVDGETEPPLEKDGSDPKAPNPPSLSGNIPVTVIVSEFGDYSGGGEAVF